MLAARKGSEFSEAPQRSGLRPTIEQLLAYLVVCVDNPGNQLYNSCSRARAIQPNNINIVLGTTHLPDIKAVLGTR